MTAVIVNTAPWMRDAVCRGHGNLFFPEGQRKRHQTERAKRFCAVCPFTSECLELALTEESGAAGNARYGVWGGCTPAERRRIWDDRVKRATSRPATTG
jgi:hypothetical protein